MRVSFAVFAALLLAVTAAPARADLIAVGDMVRLSDSYGTTGGGEFNLSVNDETFITFCLQRTEYIDFTNTFRVDGVTTYAISDPTANGGDGTGRDYLSQQTAYLYTMFRGGTLSGYDYFGSGRTTSANLLQNAIWMFENELAMNASNPFVVLANNVVASGAWSGLGDVRVLNLSYQNGVEAQDQLAIQSVPEPSSLLLFGVGLLFAARRLARRPA